MVITKLFNTIEWSIAFRTVTGTVPSFFAAIGIGVEGDDGVTISCKNVMAVELTNSIWLGSTCRRFSLKRELPGNTLSWIFRRAYDCDLTA